MRRSSILVVCLFFLGAANGVVLGYTGQNNYVIVMGQPVIDGVISPGEWDSAEWIEMNVVYGGGPPYDLSEAKWAAMWSPSTNLVYVVVTGRDTSHNFHNYVSWNTQDDVEIYVDPGNLDTYNYHYTAQRYAQHYFIGPNGSGGAWSYIPEQSADNVLASYAAGVNGEIITYECAIKPYSDLNLSNPGTSPVLTLELGQVIGLDICMVTSDGSATLFLCENGETGKFRDAGTLLDLTLVETLPSNGFADNKYPADTQAYVPADVVLAWTPGPYAVYHDVYLGTDPQQVADATTSDLTGIYRQRQSADANTYDTNDYAPAGLEPAQTYYWRIDEVNDADPNSPWKGAVWSFTVELAAGKGDLTGDRYVDIDDLSVMAGDWLKAGSIADIAPITGQGKVGISDGDGLVDMKDLALLSGTWRRKGSLLSDNALEFCRQRLINTSTIQTTSTYPSETDTGYTEWAKTFDPVPLEEGWTLGFFPGCLWYMYELTGDSAFLDEATSWTTPLENQKNNAVFGDHGFVLLDSFGHAYRLTGNTSYRDIVVQGANSLASRYDPDVGCVRSWSWGDWADGSKFTVVVDTMMNIEILFWAARNGGSSDLYDKAYSHADKTRLNHVRPDGSTYHVVVYDENTGAILEKTTAQGYSTESTWSRGQAWALYGFTMSYRETGDPNFLETAKKAADYFVDNLPEDYVPYADFEHPDIPNVDKDSSAAAITASGLLELCTLVDDPVYEQKYHNAVKNILTSLSTRNGDGGYLAQDTDGDPTSPSILRRACRGARSPYLVERGLIYGDYFLIEALMRYYNLTDF